MDGFGLELHFWRHYKDGYQLAISIFMNGI